MDLLRLTLALLAVALLVGCGKKTPAPPSPIATPPAAVSVLPTPPIAAVHDSILIQFALTDPSTRSTLEISDPDGSNRRTLAEVASSPGSVAVSSNERYIAFFTADAMSDGALLVWDVQDGETMLQIPVPAETSESFFDAAPVRYLAWSPNDQSLACVMHRDLHLVDVAWQDMQVLVHHREEQYNVAGMVTGSIGRPTWAADGRSIIYDIFSPPEMRSGGADLYRDVEYVDVSTGATELVLEDARIAPQVTAAGEQEVILQHDDGRFFSLDLTTLEVEETVSLPKTQGPPLCEPQNNRCALIMSEQGERDLLRLELAPQESQIHDVHLADLGETEADCQFQSVLWSPGGETLLATVGCAGRVALWSIGMSDLEATHLTDWAGVNTVTLLSWFE